MDTIRVTADTVLDPLIAVTHDEVNLAHPQAVPREAVRLVARVAQNWG